MCICLPFLTQKRWLTPTASRPFLIVISPKFWYQFSFCLFLSSSTFASKSIYRLHILFQFNFYSNALSFLVHLKISLCLRNTALKRSCSLKFGLNSLTSIKLFSSLTQKAWIWPICENICKLKCSQSNTEAHRP